MNAGVPGLTGGGWSEAISDARSQIEALFRRHAPGVGGYVMARTGDPDLAETITAQVFALVVRKFDQCRESPAAWLWSIVRNELARHYRSIRSTRGQQRIDGKDQLVVIDEHPGPDHALNQQEANDRLHEALKQLDEDEHTIVYMKFFQDLPNVEIAEALKITANSLGVKIHRTLKKLRGLIEPVEPGESGETRRRKPQEEQLTPPAPPRVSTSALTSPTVSDITHRP